MADLNGSHCRYGLSDSTRVTRDSDKGAQVCNDVAAPKSLKRCDSHCPL